MIYNLKSDMNSAIILASGLGIRTKLKTPKQFIKIDSENLIVDYSIKAFKNNKSIDEVILVVPEKWVEILSKKYKNIKIVIGGNSRSKSSFLGLNACSSETKHVLIHDAARPFISSDIIVNIIQKLNDYDAVIPIYNCTDSIIEVKSKSSFNYLNRDTIKYIQTPQGFNYRLINAAYKNLNDNSINFSDDFSVMKNYKNNIHYTFIEGDSANFKLTSKHDIYMAKLLLK